MKPVWFAFFCLFSAGCLRAQESFLTAPTGSYPVGRTLLAWTDTVRLNNPLEENGPKRMVAVWIWYPALPKPGAQTAEWAPGKFGAGIFSKLPKQSNTASPANIPSAEEMTQETRTHAYVDAPVSAAEKKFPLILFSPGLGQQPSAYADVIEDLVSHGYIVAGIVPTNSVDLVPLPDDQLLPRVRPKSEALGFHSDDEFAFYGREGPVWIADMRFVLNQLEKLNADSSSHLRGRMDFSRVGAFGHSFGGTTSTTVALEDPRVKAVIDIDGYVYGSVREEPLGKPFLHLQSDHSAQQADMEKLPADDFKRANFALRQRDFKFVYDNAKPGYVVAITGADHMFSWDVLLIPSVSQSYRIKQTGTISAERAHVITKAYVDAFFDQCLKGKKSPLLVGPTSPYPEVTFQTNAH